MKDHKLTDRQRSILDFIEQQMASRGFPPSVREIGAEIGLNSPSSVHNHLNNLEKMGYLSRDPSIPRGIKVSWDPASGSTDVERRPVRHVPMVGHVAAGTNLLADEQIEESYPLPADLTGEGDLFMLQVRGDSMIDLGILEGDFVVVRAQQTADKGDVVVAGIPGEEVTVKTFDFDGEQIVLIPANSRMHNLTFAPDEVNIFGKVVSLLRRF